MLPLLMLFTLFCLIGYFYFQSLRKSLPPGPTPVPLLGNLPQLARGALAGKSIREVLQEFKKDYGRVFCFWLGPLPTVMVADHELAVQTFVGQGERHTGRLQPFMANFFRKGRGLVISEGQPWLEHRRFVLHTLRDFGLGRNLMEERIRDEIDYACEDIDAQLTASSDGKAIVKPLEAFNVLVGSIINRMILGYRFGPARQQEFFHLKHELDDMLERSSVFDMAMNEWVVKLPGFKQRFKMFQGVVGQIVDFVQKNIDERKEKIASGQHVVSEEQPQDLMDAYFVEMKKRKEKGDSETFNEGELTYCILDLWIAGMETTIVTLMWGFSFLLLHPEELKKCQKEIDDVTGGSRPVGLQDRAQLPYLLATVQEIQRMSSILNMNLWRKSTKESQVGDYTLPSGTILTAQLSLLLSDETNFESPREFRPSRFLHNKELEAKNLPFGIGKRSCLGESLARAELFLILGALLQKYNFEMDPTAPPKMTPVNRFATLNRPCKFNLVVKKRN